MSQISPWRVPIVAEGARSTELLSLAFDRSGLTLRLLEEHSGRAWRLSCSSVQAVRVTTEECSAKILLALPRDSGAFFEVIDSDWIRDLGGGGVAFLAGSHHYTICCYDEIIEFVGTTPDIGPESGT